jgi:hypothetical protein
MGPVGANARRVGAAAILAAAGALLLGAPALADPPPLGTVAVNPNHGPPTATVHATYSLPGFQQHCPAAATFAWDNLRVGAAKFVATPRACVAAFSFPPPPIDRAPGGHQVSAKAGDTGFAGAALYVIDLGASPSASRSPSARPTPTPTRTRAAPTPTQSTEDAPAAPAPSESVAAAGSPEAAISNTAATARTPWVPWVMVGGGALVLGGVAVIGVMLYQGRRPAGGLSIDDAPTVEQPRLEE